MKKTIVISAISLRSGGTLSILLDCLRELSDPNYSDLNIYALVKKRELIPSSCENIHFLEIDGTNLYVKRLYYEYFYFKKLSLKLHVDLWLSLHDMTPNVVAKKRAVYCHNPSPFYRISLKELLLDPKFVFFNKLYRFVYKTNIKKNDHVIVQQDWLRRRFSSDFKLDRRKIIVAHPHIEYPFIDKRMDQHHDRKFIYPCLPRVFKNVEVIGEAIRLLRERGVNNFSVILTMKGTENNYARYIKKKYGDLPQLKFLGQVSRSDMFNLYSEVDSLIFPSKLETWGLPISEFKQSNKPILVADLPYAHETVGDYQNVSFFDPASPEDLANEMLTILNNQPLNNPLVETPLISAPMAKNWKELFEIIL